MGRHTLETFLDAASLDHRSAYMSIQRYDELYEQNRRYADHRIAGWWSNRFEGQWCRYREDEAWTHESFIAALYRSRNIISNSQGWLPNRVAKIYREAYELNARYDTLLAKDLV